MSARVRARPATVAATCLAGALACASISCRGGGVTELVLVIDTDMAVPVDLDRVDIAVTGSGTNTAAAPPIGVELTGAGAPQFPLTLGLTPAAGPGAVTVSVSASLLGKLVVAQDAATAFVDGSSRVLHMLLLGSCIGTACPAEQTCRADGCAPAAISGSALPVWTGRLPAPPPPAATPPLAGRTVWANGWHSCANEGKTLYCWGQNSDGEVGNDSTRNANTRRPVMNVHDPAAVGLGQLVTCICDRAGAAWCWGRNVEGQLGIGSTSMGATVPTRVPGVDDCAQIAGGKSHTCLVHGRGGTVSCWGGNDNGQVGQPASGTPVTSPVTVPGLADVVEVQAGERSTCARKTDMTVQCWGDNGSGQLGDGTTTSRATPAPVTGLAPDVVEIAAGRMFACARHATGGVSCWGSNGDGQLGDGGRDNESTPVDVRGVVDAAQVAAGFKHACALRRTGVVSCWGGNAAGQLGIGTTAGSLSPVDVMDLVPATSIAAGSVHTCARHAGGLSCWGENIVNQIGDGTTTDRYTPVSVAGFQ